MHGTDFVVVGGGIVGLAIARAIVLRQPGCTVEVLEKEEAVGLHASGRNSGVLHAGFYYSPDSLKAQLTRDGNQKLREFCHEHYVPVHSCGKVVVASEESQLPALDKLASRADANGVEVDVVTSKELSQLEPLARTIDRALWSPNTGVADPKAVIDAMQDDLVARGATIGLKTAVQSRPGGVLETADGRLLSVGHVVNASGLYADRLARDFGFCDDYVVLPFKGLYWYGTWPTGRLKRHVYPVPDPRNPFLGVHFTVTHQGGAKVGPTAIPIASRENYTMFHGLRWSEVQEVAVNLPRFLLSDKHDSWQLMRAEMPKYLQRNLVKAARALVPSARSSDFGIRGKPGIRAQLLDKESGQLEMDFIVRGDEKSTHVLNAVSPAWTSSLSFAEFVVDRMVASGAI